MTETTSPSYGVKLGVIPYDRSYWIIPGKLLAGFYPASEKKEETTEKLRLLLSAGVNCVINLTEEEEKNYDGTALCNYTPELKNLAQQAGKQIACHRISIPDLDIPSPAVMKQILDTIDDALKNNKIVYVHCWGGRGRTGTVAGCYLARHGMATGEKALQMVKYLRRTDARADTESPETEAQKQFVRNWKISQ